MGADVMETVLKEMPEYSKDKENVLEAIERGAYMRGAVDMCVGVYIDFSPIDESFELF